MPTYKMQYQDENGNELEKPIKVLVHETKPLEAGGHEDLPEDQESQEDPTAADIELQNAELLSFLNAQAVEEKPNVSDLKPNFTWITKVRRDQVWDIYTQETNKESV